jgi:hypothetical protein
MKYRRPLTKSEKMFLWVFYGTCGLGIYVNLFLTVHARVQMQLLP